MSGSAGSGSSGFVQGLLGSLQPWLTGGSPSALNGAVSNYGGLDGLLAAMDQAAGPDTSQARLGAALQRQQAIALQQAQQRQQLAMGTYGLQRMAQTWPILLGAMRKLGGQGGAQQPGGAAPAAPGTPSGAAPVGVGMPGAMGGAPPSGAAAAPPQSAPQQGAPVAAPGAGPMAAAGDPTRQALGTARLGALLSLAGMPGGQGLSSYAKLALQYSPQIATQLAAAKNPLSQDLALVRQYAASGNRPAAEAAYFKFLKDAGQVNVAGWSGNVTTLGGLTPQQLGVNAFLPSQGIQTSGGRASIIPGMAGIRERRAGAQALGSAQGKVTNVGGVPIPLTDVLGGGAAPGGTPAGAAPGAPMDAGLPGGGAPVNPFLRLLGAARYTSDTAAQSADLGKIYQEGADAARTTNYALDQMIADAKNASLGPAAGFKEWYEKKGAGLAQMMGVKVSTPQLDSYQQLDKYGNQVAFAAARQMGSREAAQVVQLQMESNPNKSLTPGAFADLAGSMKAMNNYIMAKNLAVQQLAQQNGGNLELASAQWTRGIDPRVWDLTLSPAMGEKWAQPIGKAKIEAAWPYLTAAEQQSLVQNIPMGVRKAWLGSSTP